MAEEKWIKEQIASLELKIAELASKEDKESTTQRRAYKYQLGQLHFSLFTRLAKSDPYQAVQSIYQSAMLGFWPAYDFIFNRNLSLLRQLHLHAPYDETPPPEGVESPEKPFFLGLQSLYGIGKKINGRLAHQYFEESAHQGHAGAQERLAACLWSNWGAWSNKFEAVQWQLKAAKQGHPHAQNLVSIHYLTGNYHV